MAVQFGFTLPQRGVLFGIFDVKQMMDLARRADECPLFDSLWVGDSMFAKPRPESLTLLGALAAITQRLKLGVGCMASFPIRDPLVFAYQWANLDLLSNGRMLLAACTGIIPSAASGDGGLMQGASAAEGSHWNIPDKERGPRLVENIRICRRLWGEEHVSFEGKFRRFSDVTVEPKPVQRPCPIWIAANPPTQMATPLRRVARFADGWMTVQIFPRMFADNWNNLQPFLRAEGRDPAQFPNMAYHNINIGPDRTAALEESLKFLENYYGPIFAPQMVEAWTAAGTPTQCIEDLRRLIGDGAKAITLRITAWNQQEQFKRLVNEILPRV